MTNTNKDEKIKTKIREAALELFQKWGLIKTTMEDIAKAAAKGKSTLYYYYKSKDEIFDEIVTMEFNSIFTKAQEAMKQQTTAEGKLRAYLLCTVNEGQKRMSLYEIVVGEIKDLDSVFAKIRREFDQKELSIIRGIIEEGIRTGELSLYNEKELTDISTIFLLSIKAIMFDLLKRLDFHNIIDRINLFVTLFIRGLSKA